MTMQALPRSDAAPQRPGLDRDTAMRLAADEYTRCADLLARLEPHHWSAPTVNTGWDVRDTAGHMLGMMQMMSSLPQLVGQMATSMRQARKAKAPVSIDHLTALQVRRTAGLSTAELLQRWRDLAPKAVRGRARVPGFLRGRSMPEAQLVGGHLERWTFAYLVDVILTRDPFMHRLDICAATGLDPRPDAEHDGRLVADVVRDWAQRHNQPFRLTLTGPAGGAWDTGGEPITLDALDFCRIVSGRGTGTGLLTTAVPF
ncbi:maleylpyruvate isomerase family mycothiol-dependent enzyme [Dactylosporangium aurantiacum]|uniref:Maleylpyruvate isomerase family mycothiol-dependent enzyme n=1 Tax=Dactylosporangium aurantiacum TaxID=35754 RepID=A0A9Q9MEC3_9ACTN|nr:maleylpyruvate isomerase family mycothiol-dependent enzyme [Dactylosporangium aurantiacum]MDG6109582.1 maleylpyruvate isomerase family mycothiol-dependent enzyme [Dactylosporangium aurantiacum]UWZ51265.1 maleylpyruvate isomerase family mycothiol-dependent enzyme [Dactylosporangium aurantiacum]